MTSQAEEQMYREWVQQIQYYQKLADEFQNNLLGLEKLKQDIKDIESLKGNEEMLAPIANGIFIEAKLKNNSKLKINIGNGVVVEKTIPETIKLLEKQEEEIKNTLQQVDAKLTELYNDADNA